MTRLILSLCFLTAATVLLACADRDEAPSPDDRVRVTEPEDAVDEPLMLALAVAKNFHHEAKVYMADGKPDEAIAAVQKILSVQFPDGAPEGEDVRLDAHAMLAKLYIGQGRLDDAMKAADAGLAAATRDSFFRANLHTVRGEVLQAQALALAATGDTDEIKAQVSAIRRQAIEAFEASNAIVVPLQERLYNRIKDAQP
jgi:tetratricopeptide (TPR) repeat protein